MSLECRECERDLRGPHDESCSLYEPPGTCRCGHSEYRHDEEGMCNDCDTCAFYKFANDEERARATGKTSKPAKFVPTKNDYKEVQSEAYWHYKATTQHSDGTCSRLAAQAAKRWERARRKRSE